MSGQSRLLPLALCLLGCSLLSPLAHAGSGEAAAVNSPETISINPARFDYREAGEFYRNNLAVDGPKSQRTLRRPLVIMKYQVSAADYEKCVGDGFCMPRETSAPASANLPVTGVSFDDAQAYAGWLSARTGEAWRLPSDEELAKMEEQQAQQQPQLSPEQERLQIRQMELEDRKAEREHQSLLTGQTNQLRMAELAQKEGLTVEQTRAKYELDMAKLQAHLEDRREERAFKAQALNAELASRMTTGAGV